MLIALASVPVSAQSIRWFPEINSNNPSSGSLAWDISADGQVIVGTLRTSAGFRPFRWTREGGYQNLFVGALNVEGGAFAISDSGQVVVGFAGHRAFRWTESGGLELLPPALLDANDVSADGSVIVGTGVNGAARLTPNGIQTIAQQGAVPWGGLC
ncbi:MAG: hypothetical protein RMK45_02095 [Armatimonadota bacterium]|nr:hypothetical protein [Armatimonadota bacterium]